MLKYDWLKGWRKISWPIIEQSREKNSPIPDQFWESTECYSIRSYAVYMYIAISVFNTYSVSGGMDYHLKDTLAMSYGKAKQTNAVSKLINITVLKYHTCIQYKLMFLCSVASKHLTILSKTGLFDNILPLFCIKLKNKVVYFSNFY